jgi:hypothetical protein
MDGISGGGNLILEALDVSDNYSWVNSGVCYCQSSPMTTTGMK